MLQVVGRSRVITCHSREIGNILLYYYHMRYIYIYDDNWRPGGTGLGFGYGLGCASERGSGAYVPPVSIKDRPLHLILVKSQISLSRAYTCLWELGRLVMLLSLVPALFGPVDWRRGQVDVLAPL